MPHTMQRLQQQEADGHLHVFLRSLALFFNRKDLLLPPLGNNAIRSKLVGWCPLLPPELARMQMFGNVDGDDEGRKGESGTRGRRGQQDGCVGGKPGQIEDFIQNDVCEVGRTGRKAGNE